MVLVLKTKTEFYWNSGWEVLLLHTVQWFVQLQENQ